MHDDDHDENEKYWGTLDRLGGSLAIALVAGLWVYLYFNGFGVRP